MEPDRTSDTNPEPGPGVAGASLQDSARPGGPGGPGGWHGSQEEQTGSLFPVTKPRVLLGLALADVQAAGKGHRWPEPSGQGGG